MEINYLSIKNTPQYFINLFCPTTYLRAFETPSARYKGIEDYVFKHCYKHKHSGLWYELPSEVGDGRKLDENGFYTEGVYFMKKIIVR